MPLKAPSYLRSSCFRLTKKLVDQLHDACIFSLNFRFIFPPEVPEWILV